MIVPKPVIDEFTHSSQSNIEDTLQKKTAKFDAIDFESKPNFDKAGFEEIDFESDEPIISSQESKLELEEDPRLYGIPEGAGEPISTITGKPIPIAEEEFAGSKAVMSLLPHAFAAFTRGAIPEALETAIMQPMTKFITGHDYVSPITEAQKVSGERLPKVAQEVIGIPVQMIGAVVPLSVAFKTADAALKTIGLTAKALEGTPLLTQLTYHIIRGGTAGGVYGGIVEGTITGVVKDAALFAVLEGVFGTAAPAIKKISESNWYRRLTIKERGLITEQLARYYKEGMSEADILRFFGPESHSWKQALAARKVTTEVKRREIRIKEEPPRPQSLIKPEDITPSHTFTSKKGNYYYKSEDKWYDNKGKEVTNRFVIRAAEEKKIPSEIDKVFEKKEAPEVVETQTDIYHRDISVPAVREALEFGNISEARAIYNQTRLSKSELWGKKIKREIDQLEIKGLGPSETSIEQAKAELRDAVKREREKPGAIMESDIRIIAGRIGDDRILDALDLKTPEERLRRLDELSDVKPESITKVDRQTGISIPKLKVKRPIEKEIPFKKGDLVKDSGGDLLMEGIPVDRYSENTVVLFDNLYREREGVLQSGTGKPDILSGMKDYVRETGGSEALKEFNRAYNHLENIEGLVNGLREMSALEFVKNKGMLKEVKIESKPAKVIDIKSKAEPPKSEPKIDPDEGEQSPFFQTKEEAIAESKVYEGRKIVDVEVAAKEIINRINRAYHGDKSVDITKAKNDLSELATRVDEFDMAFDNPADFRIWKEIVSEAAIWAREIEPLRLIKKRREGVELYSGVDPAKAVKLLKSVYRKFKGRLIKSVNKDQSQIIKDIAELHTEGKIDADITYSKGTIWKNTGIEPKYKLDKRIEGSGIVKSDIVKGIPLKDSSVNSVMFDPPFLVEPTKGRKSTGIITGRFTKFETVDDLWNFFKKGLDESFRILKPGGKLIVKIQDIGRMDRIFASSVEMYNFAVQTGFKPIDRFIYTPTRLMPLPPHVVKQVRARRAHSDFWVFEKPKVKYTHPKESGVELYTGIPLDKAGKLISKLASQFKRKVPEKPPNPFPSVKEEAIEIVRRRRGRLNLANYETNKFVSKIERKTTPKQREVFIFALEKTNVPKEFNRPDLQKVLDKDRKHIETVSKEIKGWFDEGWKKIKYHIPDLSVKQIEDYVTHLWDIPKHKKAEAVAWFSTQNRLLERRFISTYAEGIKRGYKPKTLDILEIIKAHDSICNRAIENVRFIKNIMAMKRDGISLIQWGDDAPLDWIEVNYPAITRQIPLSEKEATKKGEFVKGVRAKAHPELAKALKVIFEERFNHPIISAYEAMNGIIKKTNLSLSLFHHGALFEVGVALIGTFKTLNIYFNPVKIYKGLVKGELDLFTKEKIARKSILRGVQYGATADVPVAKIQRYLDDLAKMSIDVPLANKLTKFLSNFNSVWDKALWSYLHDTLKLYGYESLVSKIDPKLNAAATKRAEMEIAQFVNDTFGGQNWDTLMISPKEVQMLTWALLSADWTYSTTRQALAPTGIGRIYKETAGLRRKVGWIFWLRAALFFGVGMNMLNAMFRDRDMKENPQYYEDREYSYFEKTMFGNTIGKKTYLFKGRYNDGTERYIRWGKQFRDFFELLIAPFRKLGGKMAPVPQLMSEVFSGHTLSGFKNDDIYGTKGLEKTKGIFKTIVKAPLPISVKRFMKENMEFKSLDIVMQSSKGMSRYTAMEYFKKAIIEGDEDLLTDTYIGTLRNNLPAFTLFNSALSWVETEIVIDIARDIESIEDARNKLSAAKSAYDKKRHGRILRRLEKERADKEAGLKLLGPVIEKARSYRDLGLELDKKVPKFPTKGIQSKELGEIRFE